LFYGQVGRRSGDPASPRLLEMYSTHLSIGYASSCVVDRLYNMYKINLLVASFLVVFCCALLLSSAVCGKVLLFFRSFIFHDWRELKL
jgi:hypothetical protein